MSSARTRTDEQVPPGSPAGHMRELERRVRGCTACGLSATRRNAAPGDGPDDARLMLIGIAPRRHEDLRGVALAGGSRNVVDHALEEAGIDPDQVRVTNLVRCRTPTDRDPTAGEVRTCSGHLRNEIALVSPEVIVGFGTLASSVVYGRPVPVERVAGYRLDVLDGVTLIPTYHPTDVIRGVPHAAGALRRDLAVARAVLDGRLPTGAEVLEEVRAEGAAGG